MITFVSLEDGQSAKFPSSSSAPFCAVVMGMHGQKVVVAGGESGRDQRKSTGVEIVVKRGVEKHVEDNQRVLGQGEQLKRNEM